MIQNVITQEGYGKVVTASIGALASVAAYFLSKNSAIRVLAVAGGAWSALAAYEAFSQMREEKERESKDKEVQFKPPLPDKGSMYAGLSGPEATPGEIAALEREIKKLSLSGSPTGLPDPDLGEVIDG